MDSMIAENRIAGENAEIKPIKRAKYGIKIYKNQTFHVFCRIEHFFFNHGRVRNDIFRNIARNTRQGFIMTLE